MSVLSTPQPDERTSAARATAAVISSAHAWRVIEVEYQRSSVSARVLSWQPEGVGWPLLQLWSSAQRERLHDVNAVIASDLALSRRALRLHSARQRQIPAALTVPLPASQEALALCLCRTRQRRLWPAPTASWTGLPPPCVVKSEPRGFRSYARARPSPSTRRTRFFFRTRLRHPGRRSFRLLAHDSRSRHAHEQGFADRQCIASSCRGAARPGSKLRRPGAATPVAPTPWRA